MRDGYNSPNNTTWNWLNTIYLKNLPTKNFREFDLDELFRAHVGRVLNCKIFRRDGESIGEGILTFNRSEDATKAVEIMHMYDLVGFKIHVCLDPKGKLTNDTLTSIKIYNESKSKLEKIPVANSNTKKRKLSSSDIKDKNNNNMVELVKIVNKNELKVENKNELMNTPVANSNNNKRKLSSSDKPMDNLLELMRVDTKNELRKSPVENLKSPQKRQKISDNDKLNLTPLMDIKSGKFEEVPKSSRQVFVHNIDYQVRKQEISEEFSKAGLNPTSINLLKKNNKFMGLAQVDFESESEAIEAVSLLHNRLIGNRRIGVRLNFKNSSNESERSNKESEIVSLPAGLKTIGPKINERIFSDTESVNSLSRSSSLSVISKQSPESFQKISGKFKGISFILA